MAERAATGGMDLEALRRAAEGKDADSMLGLYADDASTSGLIATAPPAPR